MTGSARRRGRPAGEGNSRDAVLEAAGRAFAEHGYDGASLRRIAAQAGVDPGMLRHWFGDKLGLFRATLAANALPQAMLADVLVGPTGTLGERLVQRLVTELDTAGAAHPMIALIRSAVSHDESTALLRAFVTEHVLARVAGAVAAPDPALRASLVGSQVIGLVMARYVVRIEPLASADRATVVRAIAPTVQRYLTGELDIDGGGGGAGGAPSGVRP